MFSAREKRIEGVELWTVADVATGVRQLRLDVEAADGCSAGGGLGVALKYHERFLNNLSDFCFSQKVRLKFRILKYSQPCLQRLLTLKPEIAALVDR